jgi:hypothetical protein
MKGMIILRKKKKIHYQLYLLLIYVLPQEDFQQSDIEVDNNDTLDAFGINPNVSNSSDYDTEVVPNLFEGYIVDDNTHKSSSLSLELYHIAPIYDEYTNHEK